MKDTLRTGIAERATAAEKAEREALEAARQKRIADSLALVSDNAFLEDSLSRRKGILLRPSLFKGIRGDVPQGHYYIVAGSFRAKENAEAMLSRLSASGYEGVVVSFRNGFHAVGIMVSESLRTTLSSFAEMKAQKVCPADAWILVNDQND